MLKRKSQENKGKKTAKWMKKLPTKKNSARKLRFFLKENNKPIPPDTKQTKNHQIEMLEKEQMNQKHTEWHYQHTKPSKGKNRWRKESGMEDKAE